MPERQTESVKDWKQIAIERSVQAYSRELALQKRQKVNEILVELSNPKE